MFAKSATSSAKSSAGYICLACRHQRILSSRQTQHQRRWNSESAESSSTRTGAAAAATPVEAVDDWLLPFNSLSDDYGEKKKKKPEKISTPTKADGRKDQSIDDLRLTLSGHLSDDGDVQRSDTGGESAPRARRLLGRKRARSTRPNATSSLLQSLDQTKSGDHGGDTLGVGASGGVKGRKSEHPRSYAAAAVAAPSRGTPTRITSRSSNSEMQALWESLGPELRAEIDELAAERSQDDNEAQYDDYLEKSAAVSVPEPQVKSTEPVPFPSFSSQETAKISTPSRGFFSSTLNYFKESFGLSNPSSPKPSQPEQAEPQIQAEPKAAESSKKRSVKKNYSVESAFEVIKLNLPRNVTVHKSPVERLEESTSRSPWGTNASAASRFSRRVASFEDIAGADRASPKKPIATSVTARPFGVEPPNTIAGLRKQLAQTLAKDEKPSHKVDPVAIEEASGDATPLVVKKSAVAKAKLAHSRLLELYTTRDDVEEANAKSSTGDEDTMDLAYLRRQYNQDRAQQDAKPSIHKRFTGRPLSDVIAEPAASEKATRAVEGNPRVVRRINSKASSDDVREESTVASTDAPRDGMSLGAAMRTVSKKKVGRPAKEPTALRHKEGVTMKHAIEAEKLRIPSQDLTPEPDLVAEDQAIEESDPTLAMSVEGFRTSTPSKLHITPLDIPQPPVPFLQYGLDRVLFNPGVYQLQDQVSRVYNFDPYLQNIMPNVEFDFDSLKEYKTSSKDEALAAIAKEHGNKYIGSTSSMTSAMGHFHYLLSNWRPLNYGMLSNDFVAKGPKSLPTQLTQINRAPTAIFLRWKNGTYAIDADKEHDSANVLMLLGKSMELLLTLPKSDFERYRKSDPRKVSEEQRTAPESYQYTTMRDFLMRSQLDAYDPRLPGNGTFDLKTRAVVSVRMAADDHEPMTGYEIYAQQGKWGSYEKEFFDMMRSTVLKYMLQARMGRMNGIFVAYHNVERMFGFQYLPIADMDRALHGQTDPSLGDQEFRATLDMMNEVFNAATTKFPEQSLRIHFETREEEKGGMPTALHVFAEPMSEEDCDKIQSSQRAKIAEWERTVMGKDELNDEGAVGETQAADLSADEFANTDLSNDVAQDDGSVDLVDEVAEVNVEDETTAYSRSLLESEKEVLPEDATTTHPVTDNSSSNADPKFLNALAKSDTEQVKPLFYATIIAQSQVNGQVVERPENLTSKDEWNIDYILKEYESGRQQWAMYDDVKSRRRMAYVKEDEEDGAEKEESGYITFLRALSEKGRALRKAKDVEETGLPVVRVEELDMERLETVESVEDYMRFLEKPKVGGTREMFG